MDVPDTIIDLINLFDSNIETYKKSNYKEEQLKNDFLNSFFIALGWDVHNKKQVKPQLREVIFEDSIRIGGGIKAPDYCFTLSGKRMFFVEAKRPFVNIKKSVNPAFQVRRYAYSAKLPLSIVTDFEEFAVYEARKKPHKNDKASVERILYMTYKEYIDRWDEIYRIFSKEAVMGGSFDEYVESLKKKKGTSEVDDDFLMDLETWREKLARNIAIRNPKLSVRELNFSVQATIDRIIFLRMCEDRGIEKYEQLLGITKKDDIYSELCKIYKIADDKYNSGLFHFKTERNRVTAPDQLTINLQIDNSVLKDMITHLYFPDSPYEFSVLPPFILGSVYEQFLGKVIRLTPSHRAKVEEKPEVKKAGGVYYTPEYVVNYIVENSLGELLKNRSHKQVSKIKILDPACGSGSFLISAYSYLLQYHLDYYVSKKNPQKYQNEIYQRKTGEWYLTVKEKKRILLNNIYGVDIDPQAVEVTKLSLLLKVLEGESRDVFEQQQKLWQERALPDLCNNIKCGNSLIAPDYYKGGVQTKILEEDDLFRINVFNWEREFNEIFADGGFDCVIGNPPWGYDFSEEELCYLRKNNKEIIVRMIDSFMYFVHQSSKKIKSNGVFGMIIPDVLLYQGDNLKLREYILTNFKLDRIVNLGNDVFKKVTRPSCIVVYSNKSNSRASYYALDIASVKKYKKENEIEIFSNYSKIKQKSIIEFPNKVFVTDFDERHELLANIQSRITSTLKDYIDSDGIQRGVSPDYKDAFVISSEVAINESLEEHKLRDVIFGGHHIKRFWIDYPDLKLIYTSRKDDFSSIPNICKYIDKFKDKITCSEVKQKKHPLYSLHRPREEAIFKKDDKIVGVITEDEIIVAIDQKNYYATDGVYLFDIKNKELKYFLVGLLNSKLITFLYRLIAIEKGRELAQVKPKNMYKLPVPEVTLTDPKQKQIVDRISHNVESIMELMEQLSQKNLESEKRILNAQIEINRESIDGLVYEFYQMNEDEINLVNKTIEDK